MLNHIVVMGRLTRDPELRYTQSQVPVASFTVAVDRDFGGRDGGGSRPLAYRLSRRHDARVFIRHIKRPCFGNLLQWRQGNDDNLP